MNKSLPIITLLVSAGFMLYAYSANNIGASFGAYSLAVAAFTMNQGAR